VDAALAATDSARASTTKSVKPPGKSTKKP
jgi:hypothetical protein